MKSNFHIDHMLAGLMAVWIVAAPYQASANDYGLAFYAAQLTYEKWEQSILPGADYTDATIAVAAFTYTARRFFDARLSWEIEAQIGKYFGDQDHWEFNLPFLGFRWHRFPWENRISTSLAWGIGPSYATQIPEIELETNESSARWLIYWYGELTLAPPKAAWELLLRLHHRSDGFGTVQEDGGSNALGAGVRYRF